MKLLAIETSSENGSIALLDDHHVLSETALNDSVPTSVQLLPAIQDLLQLHALTARDLDALAVGIGPGSYTGVRIAIATAQGLAGAYNRPVYGISSLAGLAWQAKEHEGPVAVARQARSQEAYFCVFAGSQQWDQMVVAEARRPVSEIVEHLHAFDETVLLLHESCDSWVGQLSESPKLKIQNVVSRAAAIGLIAAFLGGQAASARGEGLAARHYSPGC